MVPVDKLRQKEAEVGAARKNLEEAEAKLKAS
jgi:hypothetical protein